MFKYVGMTLEVKYVTGYHFMIEYLSDNTMRWTSLVERTDGAPMVGEETFYLHQQADEIYTLSWIEENGISVSQNLDLKNMEVYAFMSWNEPSARGGRAVLSHEGKLAFL
jgi:phenolic acid decarboxylase